MAGNDSYESTSDHVQSLVFLSCNSAIAIVTCFGNVVLLVAFSLNKELIKRNLRVNALIINLAVSDLFNGAVAVPLYIFPRYVLSSALDDPVVCVLSFVAHHYSIGVTMMTSFMIAADRYAAIVHPFWTAPRCCDVIQRWPFLVAVSWLYPGALLAALTLHGTWGRHWHTCDQSLVFSHLHYPVLGVHLVVNVALSSFFYARIMVKVRQSRRVVRKMSRVSEPPAMTPSNENKKSTKTTSTYDVSVVKTLLLLMIIFYVCFLPIGLKIFVRLAVGMPAPQPAWLLTFEQFGITFAMLSPCLDPIVYGWRNTRLRCTIVGMFTCHSQSSLPVHTAGTAASGQATDTQTETQPSELLHLTHNTG